MPISDAIALAALLVSMCAMTISYLTSRRRRIRKIRPILVFEYSQEWWSIRNVGAGQAMDVVFSRLRDGKIHEQVRLPALAAGGSLLLHFAKHDSIHRFAATYRDSEGRAYSSESVRDVSTVSSGFVVQRSSSGALVPWWQLPHRSL